MNLLLKGSEFQKGQRGGLRRKVGGHGEVQSSGGKGGCTVSHDQGPGVRRLVQGFREVGTWRMNRSIPGEQGQGLGVGKVDEDSTRGKSLCEGPFIHSTNTYQGFLRDGNGFPHLGFISERRMFPALRELTFFFFFFFFSSFHFFDRLWHMEFLGQGSDPSHSLDLSHSCDNPGSLTPCAGDRTCHPARQRHCQSCCTTAGTLRVTLKKNSV